MSFSQILGSKILTRHTFIRQLFEFPSTSSVTCSNQLKKQKLCINNIRQLQTSSCFNKTYEAEGKTVGFIVNKDMREVGCLSALTTQGFILANGEELVGPLIIFPHIIYSWHIQSVEDVTEESMELFKVMEPRVDLLILGYGETHNYTPEVRKRFTEICKSLGIRFEALPTDKALGIYNFLALEHRFVAAALIPPKEVDVLKIEKELKFDTSVDLDMLEDEEKIMLNDKKEFKKLK